MIRKNYLQQSLELQKDFKLLWKESSFGINQVREEANKILNKIKHEKNLSPEDKKAIEILNSIS